MALPSPLDEALLVTVTERGLISPADAASIRAACGRDEGTVRELLVERGLIGVKELGALIRRLRGQEKRPTMTIPKPPPTAPAAEPSEEQTAVFEELDTLLGDDEPGSVPDAQPEGAETVPVAEPQPETEELVASQDTIVDSPPSLAADASSLETVHMTQGELDAELARDASSTRHPIPKSEAPLPRPDPDDGTSDKATAPTVAMPREEDSEPVIEDIADADIEEIPTETVPELDPGRVTLTIAESYGFTAEVDLPYTLPERGAAAPPSPPPPEGKSRIGHYRVDGELGRGGMGVILVARDEDLRRHLALKVMRRDKPGGVDGETVVRFVEEAQITGQLEHPNIVPVHELSLDDHGLPFFAMKLVQGRSLADILEDLRREVSRRSHTSKPAPGSVSAEFTRTRLLQVFLKICDAVSFAHARGVIHRDLKPANVMVGEHGEVLVMDWGLAKVVGTRRRSRSQPPGDPPAPGRGPRRVPSGRRVPRSSRRMAVPESQTVSTSRSESDSSHTVQGSISGTPAYMAPEQARGDVERMGPHTDIYALGAILYEILTLVNPIPSAPIHVMLTQAARGKVMPPRQRTPDREIPPDLEAVVLKAMALSPRNRYRRVKALADDILAHLEGRAVGAASYTPWQMTTMWVKQHKLQMAVVAAAVVALIAGVFITAHLSAVKREQQVQTHLDTAEIAWREKRWADCFESGMKAYALDPDLGEEFENRLAEASARAEAQATAIRNRSRAQEVLAEARTLVMEEDPEGALRKYLEAYGLADEIFDEALKQEMRECSARVQSVMVEEAARERIVELRNEARQAIRDDDLETARQRLTQILAFDPGNDEAMDNLMAVAAELQIREENEARREEIDTIRDQIATETEQLNTQLAWLSSLRAMVERTREETPALTASLREIGFANLRRQAVPIRSFAERVFEHHRRLLELGLQDQQTRTAAADALFRLWAISKLIEDSTQMEGDRARLELFAPDLFYRYRDQVEPTGSLILRTDPPGADVYCCRYLDGRDGRLIPVPWHPETGPAFNPLDRNVPLSSTEAEWQQTQTIYRFDRIQHGYLGQSPVRIGGFPPDGYLFLIEAEDRPRVRYLTALIPEVNELPVIHLPRRADIPEGFVFIPGGTFTFASDQEVAGDIYPTELTVEDFYLQRREVTLLEYSDFVLAYIREYGPERAEAAIPYTSRTPMMRIEGETLEVLYPEDWPVIGVTHQAAEAYAQFRGARLPTEMEWEYAAGAGDGRRYPWGNMFYGGWCNMRDSFAGRPVPVPVMDRRTEMREDESPFGIWDMAGNVAEHTAWETFAGQPNTVVGRGGPFGGTFMHCRIGYRFPLTPEARGSPVGIRLAMDVED